MSKQFTQTLTIETSYETLSALLDLINKYHGIIGKTEYAGKITYCVQIPLSKANLFISELAAFTARGIKIIEDH